MKLPAFLIVFILLFCLPPATPGKPFNQPENHQATEARPIQTYLFAAESAKNKGDYDQAKALLQHALVQLNQHPDTPHHAAVLSALGNLYIATGPQQKAFALLTQAEALARETNQAALIARVLINLGNYYAFHQHIDTSLNNFNNSIASARLANNPILVAKAQANAARTAGNSHQIDVAFGYLEDAQQTLEKLNNATAKNTLRVNLASTYLTLIEQSQTLNRFKQPTYQLLVESIADYQRSGNSHGRSFARGLLGRLYELSAQYVEAQQLTQQALFDAQASADKYLLYRWHWQTGRIAQSLKQTKNAIHHYQQAITLLDTLRFQMLVAYRPPGTAFVEMIAPVYSEYIELLIKQSKTQQDNAARKLTLGKVRDTIESLKAAEIRDYFGDACVDALKAKQKPLWKASTRAVIVYPVLLKNSSILLMDFPDGRLKMHRIAMPLDELTRLIRNFRVFLEKRTTNEYRIPGKQLYDLLITPVIQSLNSTKIDTLVFVPDGPLFSIPLAALHDGKQHLIEQFSTAITPGIQLVDPSPLSNKKITPVLGGLSESVDGYPPLVYVKEELDFISKLYGGNLLMNQNFKPASLKQSLSNEDINLLHISTHGFLGNSVDSSYLLTYDGKLSINSLADYVGMFKFREKPLELLVLSACETAEADDRSALGLSGIAVRAGARSAIGSLWKVNDAATSLLMTEFYQQFQQPGISRAAALQKAQQALLTDLRYRHPGYWAAFLLINNWL